VKFLIGVLVALALLPVEVLARDITVAQLPGEAKQTLQAIRSGGPLPYRQDGTVFGNRERRLPPRERGYYREYTVPTPGARDRGARRLVAGGPDPRNPAELWYTDDHYQSFRRVRE
jgi:ribonuclease T1